MLSGRYELGEPMAEQAAAPLDGARQPGNGRADTKMGA
jgi:hypothetical protein